MTKPIEMKEKFWSSLDDSPFVMLGLSGVDETHMRPMAAKFDDDFPNTLHFFTSRDNHLVASLAQSHRGNVSFASKGHDLFASVHGTLSIELDKVIVDKFWSPMISAWYDEGKDDPSLVVLKFAMDRAEIWRSTTGDKLTYMVTALLKGDASDAAAENVAQVRF
ncbi:MAG: pyridoxamine 5'-phosphate oxidase family protein [Pseudomonadota bacterium]